MPVEDFTARLADIFEHSPWVAECAAAARPFASVDALHAAMCAAMRNANPDGQLALIRAHPQLAGKAALRGELTESSTSEQSGAGLDQCSPGEFARITEFNDAYQQRFGFPFILAVRGYDRAGIIANMAARVSNAPAVEFDEALRQIERIAALRLKDRID
ncbi:MAG: 2-oxo-4-hydroxy-4-carboxy-5-ureidoimidazoline decarboxylase [Xanthomonadales bacterium]|nr:2-oxo-4-hydroxy-4-carboxy-5-ureidoimidazoline decarboxylase [Xanthomonadales bacterium]